MQPSTPDRSASSPARANEARPAPVAFGLSAGYGAAILRPLAGTIAGLGFAGLWCNDSARPDADGLADLSVIHREAPDLHLGVGVIPLDRRSPARIASDVARLALPLDRLWLGIGSGAERVHPLRLVGDGLAELRALLPGATLFVAALGPRMCGLAGELADGVLLNWATPERVDRARGRIADGAARAGRSERDVAVWTYVRAAVGADARARVGDEARRYARSPAYARQFQEMGVAFEDVGVAGADLTAQLRPYRERLDGVVVRALPASPTLEELLEIATAAAPMPSGG